jgi:hypothetical protein
MAKQGLDDGGKSDDTGNKPDEIIRFQGLVHFLPNELIPSMARFYSIRSWVQIVHHINQNRFQLSQQE